jgi:hypothetical protein
VQLLSIIGSAGTLPSRKFAVSLFANRYSLFATRCRSDAPKIFGSAGTLPSRKLATRHSLSFHLHDLPMT